MPLKPEPLKAFNPSGRPLIVMTSSGITGTNGHAVIEGLLKISKFMNNFWVFGANVSGFFIVGGMSLCSTEAISENMQKLITNFIQAVSTRSSRICQR